MSIDHRKFLKQIQAKDMENKETEIISWSDNNFLYKNHKMEFLDRIKPEL